jgi:carbon-monoxide dehydrogenase iron sulfur subunit
MKRIEWQEDVCIGCRLCEVYCITAHSRYPEDPLKAYKRDLERPVARVVVEEEGATSFALSCRQCTQAECVKSCLTGALAIDREGMVSFDESRCIGCWTCVAACPYGAVHPAREGSKRKASKCDLCLQRGNPSCVEHCPNEALKLVSSGEGE